jgi:hypothetical protein
MEMGVSGMADKGQQRGWGSGSAGDPAWRPPHRVAVDSAEVPPMPSPTPHPSYTPLVRARTHQTGDDGRLDLLELRHRRHGAVKNTQQKHKYNAKPRPRAARRHRATLAVTVRTGVVGLAKLDRPSLPQNPPTVRCRAHPARPNTGTA